jgi:Chaperonin GroEL (HSP60 family)
MSDNTLQFITLDETKRLAEDVVNDVERAVVATMGPNGRLSVITVGTTPKVTKDGVTVAKGLKFNDPRKELINKIITEPAIKTDEECGDGTTTTIMLMAQFFRVYRAFPSYRQHAFIDEVTKAWIEELRRLSIQLEVDDPRLMQMALTSSNNDAEMSRIVVDLYRGSKEHFPSIELVYGVEDTDRVIHTDGLRMNMELSNPQYAGNTAGTLTLDNYIPVLVDGFIKPENVQELIKFCGEMTNLHGDSPVTVVIIARALETQIDGAILKLNAQLRQAGKKISFAGVRTNLGGSLGSNIMQDMACMLNSSMVSDLDQACSVTWEVNNDQLTITNNKAILIPTEKAATRIEERVEEIRKVLENYDARTRWSRRARFDEDRLRNLTGEVVNLWVGGETQSEVKERHARFEDVIKAVKSGLVNGILPGCGISLIESLEVAGAKFLKEEMSEEDRSFKTEIIGALVEVSRHQYKYLMEKVSDVYMQRNEEGRLMVTNLATGENGSPESLGVFDTAYASITALKGGSQTAKIVATLDSVIISDKLTTVAVQG